MLLFLLGCPLVPPDDSTPVDCTDLPSAVELGTGESAHVPASEGDEVVMVHGPQGGWHVWLSFGLVNLGPDVVLDVTLEDLTRGEVMAELSYSLHVGEPTACRVELSGLFGFLPYDDPNTPESESPPDWRVCDRARICASVSDAEGEPPRRAEGCVEVVLIPDPADDPDFANCP